MTAQLELHEPGTVLRESHARPADRSELPPVGGGLVRPRKLRRLSKVRNVTNDELGRHLLTLLSLHPSVCSHFFGWARNLNEVARWLCDTDSARKAQLLARVERALNIPRQCVDTLRVDCD